jgi:O-antigen ligase
MRFADIIGEYRRYAPNASPNSSAVDALSPNSGFAKPDKSLSVAFFLAAYVPIILGLSTWTIMASNYKAPVPALDGLVPAIYYMLVIVVETMVFTYAFFKGFRPIQLITAQNLVTKSAFFGLLLIAFGTTFFVAEVQYRALRSTEFWLIHLMFGMSIWWLFKFKWQKSVAEIWWLVAASLGGYACLIALFVTRIEDPLTFAWVKFGMGVFNIRMLAYYCAVGYGAALGLALGSKSKFGYWAAIAIASTMIGLIFWSATRSSVIAVLGTVGLGALLIPSFRTVRAIRAVLITFFAGIALSLLNPIPANGFNIWNRLSDTAAQRGDASSGRIALWKETIEYISVRPLFGHGDDQVIFVLPSAKKYDYVQPHNNLLQLLFQWGFVGTICFLMLAVPLWLKLLHNARAASDAVLPAFLVVNGLLFAGIFDSTLYYPYPLMMAAFALGIGIAQSPNREAVH